MSETGPKTKPGERSDKETQELLDEAAERALHEKVNRKSPILDRDALVKNAKDGDNAAKTSSE